MMNTNTNLNIIGDIKDVLKIDLPALESIGAGISDLVPVNKHLTINLGANLGNLYSKFKGSYIPELMMASSVAKVAEKKALMAQNNEKARRSHIKVNGVWYKVGAMDDSITANTTDKRDYSKLQIIACLGAAMQVISNRANYTKPTEKYPHGNLKYKVITSRTSVGLPITEFMEEEFRDKVQEAFEDKVYKVTYMGYDFILRIDLIEILAECYAYYQHLNSELLLDKYKRVFLLDCGSQSWDFVEIIDDEPTDYDSIMNAGTIVLIERIKAKISEKNKFVTDSLVNELIKDGSVMIGPDTYIREEFEDDIKEYSLACLEELDRRFNNKLNNNNCIVLMGGGAYIVEKYAKEYFSTNVVVVEKPEYANARAYYQSTL